MLALRLKVRLGPERAPIFYKLSRILSLGHFQINKEGLRKTLKLGFGNKHSLVDLDNLLTESPCIGQVMNQLITQSLIDKRISAVQRSFKKVEEKERGDEKFAMDREFNNREKYPANVLEFVLRGEIAEKHMIFKNLE